MGDAVGQKPEVKVDIVSDVMCPWCWVGKRKLESAMNDLASKYSFKVRWEPFLLRPDHPLEGVPKKKPIGGDMNDPGTVHLKRAGEGVGIDFTYKAPIYPNTVQSHVLLEFAAHKDGGEKQNEVAEILFKRYFTDGDSLTKSQLLEIAAEVGFDTAEVEKFLDDPSNSASIRRQAQNWSQNGVHGVPYFIINGKPAFSGAQDPNTFKKVIEKLASA
ncbi:uncharacterized protein YwbO [Aplysia californica]|uniref:Uncharacterized protein YwbO n=1 Tax=Aplysia californica TaxID=6500 RepID=A0ABM0JHN9_APLCA|nr:uncharacterized protein YwbO [Aplysia californica]XP_005093887.1 uncharacterized protein YwbO [Aplysia californica]